MRKSLNRILTVPTSDPDDTRRRRVLNILLVGTFAASLLGLIAISIAASFLEISDADFSTLLFSIIGILLGIAGIYWVNRKFSGRLAALLFLLLLTAVFSFSDTPEQLSNGRALFIFTLPITISSLILASQSSFLFAFLSSAIVAGLSISIGEPVNVFAIIGFFMLALVSWMSARSLETALIELRAINADLDKVVVERTNALAASLERERIEAGQNQAILNSIADGVIVFDRRWKAILANPAIKSMLEIPLEKITGRNFREIIDHPNLSAKSRPFLVAMIENDTQPIGFRIEWAGKTLSVSAAQVYNDRNENIGTVIVFRDFTREAEVERLKSTFVAIVSHELRTPLNAILGYAEMFKEAVYGPINEKQTNMADRIIKNTQRLLGLINDLLDQAQMETGKLTIQMAPVRLSELLENLHSVMDKTASDKGLRLTSEIEDDLPEVLNGDATRLHQILVNLVNNAIKFTEQGLVQVRLFRVGDYNWGMEVTDTGSGIPESDLPHIFDTFRQVETAATRVHGGFGLGLSIVKQLVSLMDGDIRVSSVVGQGTTFTITLPMVTQVELVRNRRIP